MTMYRLDSQYIGYPPIEAVVPAPTALRLLPVSPGFIARCEDPVWGPGEAIFARANGAIRLYGLCVLTPVWDTTNLTLQMNMTECPNTANLGRALYVAQAGAALVAGQYAWFLMTGATPINGTATVAADTTFGITAAGQVGANTAGKQILGGRVTTPATQTVVSASRGGVAGDNRIFLANTAGFFVGGYVSGTGVGAAAIVSYVDPQGKFIDVTVANSATVTGNVTITYNNATIFYNVATLNRSFAQGAIT
jgi:hypothetical protein